jgi:hypothetical protein
LKPKTGVESGNSPPKVSENGAPIQTGAGLEQVKQRILRAFEEARGDQPAIEQPPLEQAEAQYTEQSGERFRERMKKLSLAALQSSHRYARRRPVFEIAVPSESAEELFRQALEGE